MENTSPTVKIIERYPGSVFVRDTKFDMPLRAYNTVKAAECFCLSHGFPIVAERIKL